ncbi:unnamed protein product [Rotaria sordida]|uniref:G-protein coupled receptors family 1 profile domain-containing protein n=1 Tax=Rotaria sordida TaxID=392033 RepID=A0A816EXW4_9BILA|nr:unnamed protein product [Rotaria sordida]CAF1651764.1 unnamed protein product [Rotaria sordida]
MSNTATDWLATQFNTASWTVNQVCIPILFFVGIIGWTLNTITFSRPSLRSNSCATYFHASSWANLCVLFWSPFIYAVGNWSGYRLPARSILFCKIRIYFITMFCHTSVAFLLLACGDRFMLCSRNANRRRLCHVRIAYKMIIITIIICALLPLYIPLKYNRLSVVSNLCIIDIDFLIFDITYKSTIWAIIPPSLMLTLGSLTIYSLKQNARQIANIRIQIHSKDRQLVAMLIGQITLYITTTWPYVAMMIYNVLTQNILPSHKSVTRNAIETFALSFSANFFLYLYNAISFLIYTLTAPSFRRELFLALVPRFIRQQFHNRIGATTTLQQAENRTGKVSYIRSRAQVMIE